MPGQAQRVAVFSIAVSGVLAALKITAGWLAGSTAVLADGFEAAGDMIASSVVLFGLAMAARPPDAEHPYGHGRLETLSGFTVGLILALAGTGICLNSLKNAYEVHQAPKAFAIWPLLLSITTKTGLAIWKFREARVTNSAGLKADAFNDSIDILSGIVALVALGLTLWDPQRFLTADHFGGLGVGLIVIFIGLRVVRDTSLQLMDTMPDQHTMAQIRAIASSVPGALGVEKCYARKTGLQYHVDLHLEVDPDMTVLESHEIATDVRFRIKRKLDYVADVLVHVEPHRPKK